MKNPAPQISVIAIDGPAASGKSTVGQLLAEQLGFLFLDTGCMYRTVTLAVLQADVTPADETAVFNVARQIQIDVQNRGTATDGRLYTVLLDGNDVTWQIRTPEVDAHVSQISSYKDVRALLVEQQRQFGRRGQVVMVGRDIGTVVLPDAPLKLYIIASAEERARRRWQDRQRQGHPADYDSILADVQRRDQIDSNRAHSPLRPAADAIQIDTTRLSAEAAVAHILRLLSASIPAQQSPRS